MARHPENKSPELWMHYMREGQFEEAWKINDEDLKAHAGKPCWHLPRHLQYIWDGSSLKGKRVLVRCYHGLGDTIQFIRYAPILKQLAAMVIVWVQPSLIPLLKTFQDIDELLPLHDGKPEVKYDVDVEVMELPYIFRTRLETIPFKIPYLHVKPVQISANKKINAGLVWKAGEWDQRRNIPFDILAPLFQIPDINFCILQADAVSAGWQQGFGINPGEFNLYEYAQIIAGLDLMISVDSMPAHLASALGIPVLTLLHAHADWRWMAHREDSPWYPTMRLFRQEQEGDWGGVVERVRRELERIGN